MIWIDWVGLPEHLIAILNLVNWPEKLSFQYEDFDVCWILLLGNLQLCKG